MITIDEFKRLELKVGRIIEAQLHPNADKLLVLSVDVGGVKKQVVAGIVRHYQPAELPGKLVVIVDNMEPAVIRGVESQGMLLAASHDQILTLIAPEKPIPSGALVR